MTTLKNILESIDALADRAQITRNRAFAAWFAIHFFDVDEDDALELAGIDGGNDEGIDMVFVNQREEEVIVLQAHCPESFEKKTPKAKWNALVASLPYVSKPSLLRDAGRPDLAVIIEESVQQNPGFTVSAGLITLSKSSPEIIRSVKAHNDGKVEFFYFAQEAIIEKYDALVDLEGGIKEDAVNFSSGIYEDSGDYGKAWIGSIGAAELKRLYTVYGDKLFAGNVRLFLGSRKGGINEEMIRTAKTSAGKFWALNNGITIVADSVLQSKGTKSPKLDLKRFSIVNGCQTTSSLALANAGNEAKVLARVIQANDQIKNEIVQYNNSQNVVRIWAVRAVDAVQKQLRADFKKEGIQYAEKQAGAKKKRSPLIIELDKVTQYLAASKKEYLIQAINNKGELFDQPYQKIYKRDTKASRVFLAWMVGTASEEARVALQKKMGDDESKGLLTVKSTYWILYVAYMLIEEFSDPDSPHITVAKMKSDEFKNSVKKYVSKSASLYFDAAVDTYDMEDYGPMSSVFRSSKFLDKITSKLKRKISEMDKKSLPDLVATAKSIKLVN